MSNPTGVAHTYWPILHVVWYQFILGMHRSDIGIGYRSRYWQNIWIGYRKVQPIHGADLFFFFFFPIKKNKLLILLNKYIKNYRVITQVIWETALTTAGPAPFEKLENLGACCLFLCTLLDAIYILHFSFK